MGVLSNSDFEKKAYGQHINIVDKVFNFYQLEKKKFQVHL